MHAPEIERVTIRVLDSRTALVSIRIPGVMLNGLRATRDHAGRIRLEPPVYTSRDGRRFPQFTLQPGLAESAVQVVTEQWPFAASAAERGIQ